MTVKPASPQAREGDEQGGEQEEDPKVGDAETAYASAPVKIDQRYSTPIQHHNPIELFTTTASWTNGKLTVWESSQNTWGFKYGIAEQLSIDPADVHWISPYIGGASPSLKRSHASPASGRSRRARSGRSTPARRGEGRPAPWDSCIQGRWRS